VYKEELPHRAAMPTAEKQSLMRQDSSISLDDVAPTATAGNVRRRIIKGPSRYMPAVGEWVHEFAWSITEQGKTTEFTTLSTNKQQWEIAPVFRMGDNSQASISLTVEYQVADVDSVLLVADPLASMRSALQGA